MSSTTPILRRARIITLTAFALLALGGASSYANDPPFRVQSFYFPSNSGKGDDIVLKKEEWEHSLPLKSYRIGVLIPHLKDQYWLTAAYGLTSYAERLGLDIQLYSFAGYVSFGDQRKRLLEIANRVDGIILSTIDHANIDQTIQKVGIPVIGLINNLKSSAISAKAMVSYFDAGYKAGEFIANDSRGKNISVAFFPGPKRSGWADDMYDGFVTAISASRKVGQTINVHPPIYGDTRPEVQRLRLKTFFNLKNVGDIDYIVGNAVAAKEAVSLFREEPSIKIVSTYFTRDIYDEIRVGQIQAAPHDQTIAICQIAIDMMVRTLNGEKPGVDFPYHAKPNILMITGQNIEEYGFSKLFGPKDFIPKTIEYGSVPTVNN